MFQISIGIVFRNEELALPSFFAGLESAISKKLDFEILGFDNDSSDESLLLFEKECLKRDWRFKTCHSQRNNMGVARSWILAHSAAPLIYFLDVDVKPAPDSLSHLLEALQSSNSEMCAAAGPLQISIGNAFQRRLSFLQYTWFGNFGSAQLKKSFNESEIEHAPTAHLLVKKLEYLKIGGFNSSLDRTGEDLEIHWRLSQRNKKILWVQSAVAEHNIAGHLVLWLQKSFKYGMAQTLIARIHPRFFLTRRCLPIWLLAIALICLIGFPIYFCLMLVAYLATVLIVSLKLSKKDSMRLLSLFVGTHISYLCGEVFGLLRSPETQTNK